MQEPRACGKLAYFAINMQDLNFNNWMYHALLHNTTRTITPNVKKNILFYIIIDCCYFKSCISYCSNKKQKLNNNNNNNNKHYLSL